MPVWQEAPRNLAVMAGEYGDGDCETPRRSCQCLAADRGSVGRARVAKRQTATECTNIV